jgi:hypothetical protein
MAGRGRAVVGRALIALTLAGLVAARARADGPLPDCTPSDVDVALLSQLLAIELGDLVGVVRLGDALCDPARTEISIEVRDAGGHEARDTIAVAPEGEVDPRAAARAIALAVAERAPRMLASLAVVPEPVLDVAEPTSPHEPAASLGDPAATPPARVPIAPRPSASRLGPTLGVLAHARLAPVQPSWALGLGVDLGAHLDPTWSMRGEALSTWTRATVAEGDVDAVVLAGALSFGGSVLRDDLLDLTLGARAEGGMLVAMGWQSGASAGPATLHGWLALGGLADLAIWLAPDVALVIDLSFSAVLYGARLRTWPSGVVIDLSLFDADLAAGVRFML